MDSVGGAINALREGRFVLVHDDKGRENEIDMILPAEHVSPSHIAAFRTFAGGLICLAVSHEIAVKLGLVYMHDILHGLSRINPMFRKLTSGKTPYGDRPSFSISVNHRDTYTGITDFDRALTLTKMAEVCRKIDSAGVEKFSNDFRAPGHVPILIASKGLLYERTGHTELCVYLVKIAGLVPAVIICEMLDSSTGKALSIDRGRKYASKNNIPLIESRELKKDLCQDIN
jgi:3,4-dihydroxy 2-butanone 4-phosphate synthase